MFASKDSLLTRPSGYNIARSVRLRSSASAYFNRTLTTPTLGTKWTWSGWVKRGSLGSAQTLFSGQSDVNNWGYFGFLSGDTLTFSQADAGSVTSTVTTTQVFRDPSSWYHIIVVFDSTQATAADRLKMYVNGSQITAFGTATYLSQNTASRINQATAHQLGRYISAANYLDGYLTEINFIDGQALTPSSFGETDSITGVWKPKAYSGTYGTNGFELNFSDNSNNTAATIGKDYSGNGNNWTPNNISVTAGVTYDSMQDVPTLTSATAANYAVINPIYKSSSQPTISNGNLTVAPNVATYQNAFSTIGSISGKQYCEITITGAPNSANMWGVANAAQLNSMTTTAEIIGSSALSGTGYGYYYNGQKYSAGTLSSYGNAVSSGDVMGIALDLDNGKVWFSLNGTWQASGDPAAGTNAAFTGIVASGIWFFGATAHSGGSTAFNYNFGQQPFVYTPPTGFVALNTYNLPTSTITNGAAYMAATTYTGNGSTQTITNTVGSTSFQPDFVWIKDRNTARGSMLFDSVRGIYIRLRSNSTDAEQTETDTLTAFNSNGFNLSTNVAVNGSTETYVGWQWKAGTTSASNTNGSITSTVSVGATQGFSVVTYTGSGANATVGHGLGVAPNLIIVRNRTASAQNWQVYSSVTGATKRLFLDLTDAAQTVSTVWNNTAPTSTVFSIGTVTDVNGNTNNFVAYCFAQVAGYSAFGSYTGNGSADGPFVYTGFRPRWIMTKSSTLASGASVWVIADSSRLGYNADNATLNANETDAENNSQRLDILSNGFKQRTSPTSSNGNGETYIYMAFAENPFKNALAR